MNKSVVVIGAGPCGLVAIKEMIAYLEDYARHFELDGHITYRSEVFSAEFKADGL
jgi:cation diffusion facilitator CzcD-associated flavoprotein CzcO